MKVIYIFIFATISFAGCKNSADPVSSSITGDGREKAELVFETYEHDFGKVAEGEKISYQFVYENNGSAPLAINAVSTTCGCTVPKYSNKPLKPGEKGSLEVVFDTSGRNGRQTKTITVKSNSSVPVVLLKITADVQNE